jgi:K+-sensing histidine kinase KdpD
MTESDRGLAVTQLIINFTIAAICVGIAVIFTLHLQTLIKHTSSLFFCSVMLSSWNGGLWPGLFAAFLSYIALDYYFIPPLYAFGISPEQAPDMIVFVATALFISWLNGNQKQAKESLRDARDQLDARVQERTAELEKINERLKAEIADREAAEEGLMRARTEIARIARITTVGEFAASIAHELNQPLGSIVTSADACLRWKPQSIKILSKSRFNFLRLHKFFFGSCDSLVVIKSLQHFGCRLGYPLLLFPIQYPEGGSELFYLGSFRPLL